MVMIGIDPHKRTHTAVAIDPAERVLDERLVHASGSQVPELLEWAKRLDGGERVWAIESVGGLGFSATRTEGIVSAGAVEAADSRPCPTDRRPGETSLHRYARDAGVD